MLVSGFIMWLILRLLTAMELGVLYDAKGTSYILNNVDYKYGAATLLVLLCIGYGVGEYDIGKKALLGVLSGIGYVLLDTLVIKGIYSNIINSPVKLNMLTDKSIYMLEYEGTAYIQNIVTSTFLYIVYYVVGLYLNKLRDSKREYRLYVLCSFGIFWLLSISGIVKIPILYMLMGILNPLVSLLGVDRAIVGMRELSYTVIDWVQIPLYSVIVLILLLMTIKVVMPKIEGIVDEETDEGEVEKGE